MPVIDILSSIAKTLIGSALTDFRFLPIYFVLFLLIKHQYEKYLDFEMNILSVNRKDLRRLLEESILSGLIAGFTGSMIIVFLGIPISTQGFEYLFILLAIFLLINIRYVCFAYAGGALALINLLTGFPKVEVQGLLGLIGIMHLMESILIFLDGGKGSIPVFIRKNDEIAGAFITRKFWPLPVVLLSFILPASPVGQGILMPDWWPLIKPAGAAGMAATLGAAVALLGYSDVSITRQPENRSRESAGMLFVYSLCMMCLAVFAGRYYWLKIAGALFSILAHEGIIIFGLYREKHGKPIFTAPSRGLRILEVFPGGHAELAGVRRGDIILDINGRNIQSEEGLRAALADYPTFLWIRVQDIRGVEKMLEYKCYPGGTNNLQVLTVPKEREVTYNINYFHNLGILRNLVKRFKVH